MDHVTEIKVRGYHADFYGHVNNARYLEFFEEDRWAQFERRIDLKKWAGQGFVFMVVNINVNYRRAVGVGETLVVSTTLSRIGKRSGVLEQEARFKQSAEVAADALVTFVVGDRSGKAVMLAGEVLEELKKLEDPAGS